MDLGMEVVMASVDDPATVDRDPVAWFGTVVGRDVLAVDLHRKDAGRNRQAHAMRRLERGAVLPLRVSVRRGEQRLIQRVGDHGELPVVPEPMRHREVV